MSVHDIPVDQISPNPYQPRVVFNEQNLSSLATSIRQYGVMQPIVVTKKSEGSFELISGERRLKASKLAGKSTIPAIIMDNEYSNAEKFELAIIENLQREDLNPIDKAKSFKRLVKEFGLTHSDIAQKMGKSREYISNSLRILMLPDNMLDAMVRAEISEGHARPLLMLKDRPFEQGELFEKIITDKLTVRGAEKIARSVAVEKVRKADTPEDSDLKRMEKNLAEKLGTKVSIDKKVTGEGGKLTIEYFSKEDLEKIINLVKGKSISSAPVLESVEKQDYGIDKFEENFSPQKKVGEESLEGFSKKKPKFFGDEIQGLTEEGMTDNKINLGDKISSKEDINSFDGFNITSFDENAQIKVSANNSESNNQEYKREEDIKLQTATSPKKVSPEFVLEKENNDNTFLDNGKKIEEEKKLYRETFSNFGKINNFSFTGKDEKEEVGKNIVNESIQAKEKEVNFAEENIQQQPEIDEAKPIFFATPSEEDDKKVLQKKSETQKRIDAILSGSTTVDKEYGVETQNNNTVEGERRNLPKRHSSAPKDRNEKSDIEKSPVYQQFLESKKRIEAEKERMFSEPESKNNSEIKQESNVSDNNQLGQMSENTSEFIANSGNIDISSTNTFGESNVANKIIKEDVKKKERIDAIFNGDDFFPKKKGVSSDEKKEDINKGSFGFSI